VLESPSRIDEVDFFCPESYSRISEKNYWHAICSNLSRFFDFSFDPKNFGGIVKKKTICALFVCVAILLFQTSMVTAATKTEIDLNVEEALAKFYKETSAGKKLAKKAAGILIFPKVYKAGIGIGGEYGEGALLVGNKTVDYYNVASASLGFQLGAQVKTQLVLFMNQAVLKDFRGSSGWEAGVDGSVAIATLGAGGELDTNTAQKPIIGFIFSNKGLMYNLTLEGAKITRIKK
jgi:lipid-binding SYLF domain-containing protein